MPHAVRRSSLILPVHRLQQQLYPLLILPLWMRFERLQQPQQQDPLAPPLWPSPSLR